MKNKYKTETLEKMLAGMTPADVALTDEDKEWLNSTVGNEWPNEDADTPESDRETSQ